MMLTVRLVGRSRVTRQLISRRQLSPLIEGCLDRGETQKHVGAHYG